MPRPGSKGRFLHDAIIGNLKRAGHFEKECSILGLVTNRNSVGEEAGSYVPIHVNIPCIVGTPRLGMMGRELDQTSARVYSAEKAIFFDRHFPDLTVKHQVEYEETIYGIQEVGHSVNDVFTWAILTEVK